MLKVAALSVLVLLGACDVGPSPKFICRDGQELRVIHREGASHSAMKPTGLECKEGY